jgi:predicted SprT family Zn-dependent metalloprotease
MTTEPYRPRLIGEEERDRVTNDYWCTCEVCGLAAHCHTIARDGRWISICVECDEELP